MSGSLHPRLLPASIANLHQLSELSNRCRPKNGEDRVANPETLALRLRREGIDLTASRVLSWRGRWEGMALIGRRGYSARIADFILTPQLRRQGLGSWLLREILREARLRADRTLEMEVREDDDVASALAVANGFQAEGRLVGYRRPGEESYQRAREDLAAGDLVEMDVYHLARALVRRGDPAWPWLLTGESTAFLGSPHRAFHRGEAMVLISSPYRSPVWILSLLPGRLEKPEDSLPQLINGLLLAFPGRTWCTPRLFPEAFAAAAFEPAGFRREPTARQHWRLDLRHHLVPEPEPEPEPDS
ncbi:MAG: GNAT family N-acetyltransferase [Acidobacteriota bacterium]